MIVCNLQLCLIMERKTLNKNKIIIVKCHCLINLEPGNMKCICCLQGEHLNE